MTFANVAIDLILHNCHGGSGWGLKMKIEPFRNYSVTI